MGNPVFEALEESELIEIPEFSEESVSALRNAIQEHYLEFRASVESGDKTYLQDLHILSKKRADQRSLAKCISEFGKLSSNFITPNKLDVSKISPILINVDEAEKFKRLFSLVRHTWSMPYSKGYGRRLRFIVWDDYHNAVIGIIGLQSPPADLSCRDKLFAFPEGEKLDYINRTMDVFTLGAVPPYSNLLGGKLVAGLVATDIIRQAYWSKYAGQRSEMKQSLIEQPLVGATTTSAFGRSSIYNRLKYQDRLLAKPIGYTKGFGSIHLEPLFDDISALLKSHGVYHNGGYGNGPKARWQNIVRALQKLGLSQKYLKHGLGREVFLYEFMSDMDKGMSGGSFGVPLRLTVDEYANYWKERWALPRSETKPSWKEVNISDYFLKCLS